MAEKRMFTQKITEGDPFTEMELSAQALYFHLNMNADDDGFVNSPKKICRAIGATEMDLQILIDKRFVLAFENGVVAIKHWRMHNTLKKDRYKPTQYQEQYALLDVKGNNAYTEKSNVSTLETERNQLGSTLEPQYRLDKDSIDKNSIDKDSVIESEPSRKQYGEYNNVFLTDEEYIQLQSEFPDDYDKRIENLSSYMASSGKSYKNHLATIKNWASKERKEQKQQTTLPNTKRPCNNPFLALAMQEGDDLT